MSSRRSLKRLRPSFGLHVPLGMTSDSNRSTSESVATQQAYCSGTAGHANADLRGDGADCTSQGEGTKVLGGMGAFLYKRGLVVSAFARQQHIASPWVPRIPSR